MAWVSISQASAISTALAACSGCHLISEAEWLTITQNVLSVSSNWSDGSVGSGFIYSGHNDNAPANALAADTNDANSYSGTGNSSPSNQRRTLTLTNDEVIWDLAGNVYERTAGTSTTGQPGITGETGYAWKEWPNVTAQVPYLLTQHQVPRTSLAPVAGIRATVAVSCIAIAAQLLCMASSAEALGSMAAARE